MRYFKGKVTCLTRILPNIGGNKADGGKSDILVTAYKMVIYA